MADVFELFRLSLFDRKQRSLFSAEGEPVSREDEIRAVFSRLWQFVHYQTAFHYVPLPSPVDNSRVLGGRIGRPIATSENAPPEAGFEQVQHEAWKAALILIQLPLPNDGQVVAMNHDRQVGAPAPLVASLIRHINAERERTGAYHLEIDPLFDASTFWAFAEANRNEITNLKFDFIAPNIFDGKDTLEEQLREIRDAERAQQVRVELKSTDGLQTDTQRVRQAVAYSEKGAGTIKAKTKKGKRYNSKRKQRTIVLPAAPPATPVLSRLVTAIRSIFTE